MSWTTAGGNRWHGIKLGLDEDDLRQALSGLPMEAEAVVEALESYEALTFSERLRVLRAAAEVGMFEYRRVRKDPDFDEQEIFLWRKLLAHYLGPAGELL